MRHRLHTLQGASSSAMHATQQYSRHHTCPCAIAGLFDPIDNQPFWNVPVDAINTAASQANNWLATLSSFVLLKHDNQVLPLAKGKRIAVIGPHANATTAMAGNYLGQVSGRVFGHWSQTAQQTACTPTNPCTRKPLHLFFPVWCSSALTTGLTALSHRLRQSRRPTSAARPR